MIRSQKNARRWDFQFPSRIDRVHRPEKRDNYFHGSFWQELGYLGEATYILTHICVMALAIVSYWLSYSPLPVPEHTWGILFFLMWALRAVFTRR